MKGVRLLTDRLLIRDLGPGAAELVAEFHRQNRHFHGPWDPARPEDYYTAKQQRSILKQKSRATDALHLWMLSAENGRQMRPMVIIGSITISGIIRGYLRSAFLGYKLDSRFARRGYMREALPAVIDYAFSTMDLHRLEANVMPNNDRSLKLVRLLGFRDEGMSRAYLCIRNRWEDHVRMAVVREEWRSPRT